MTGWKVGGPTGVSDVNPLRQRELREDGTAQRARGGIIKQVFLNEWHLCATLSVCDIHRFERLDEIDWLDNRNFGAGYRHGKIDWTEP